MKPSSNTVPASALGPRNGVRLAIRASQLRICASLRKAICRASANVAHAAGWFASASSGDTPIAPCRAQMSFSRAARARGSGRNTSGPAK